MVALVNLLRKWCPLALVLPILQSLGLPEEVLDVVRARIATQKSSQEGFSGKTAFVASSHD